MKTTYDQFYFNVYEQKLIARYYREIKLGCRDAWLRLTGAERKAILTYRAYYMHPEKYDTSTYASMFIPQELLVLNSDIEKIRKYFTAHQPPRPQITVPQSQTTVHMLMMLLTACAKRDIEFEPIMSVITLMHNARDGGISFSSDDIGINVTSNTIEIVDIFENKAIATLTLSIQ